MSLTAQFDTAGIIKRSLFAENVERYFIDEINHYKFVSPNGLRHRFYRALYAFFIDKAEWERQDREYSIRSDAYWALDWIGNRTFENREDMKAYLEDHQGYAYTSLMNITLDEILDYMEENRENLKNDEYLKMMR